MMTLEQRDELATRDPREMSIVPSMTPVRFSNLKAMEQSPQHYLHALQGGREETLAMRLGSGTHAKLFGTPEIVVYRGGELADAKGKIKTYTAVRNGACWEAFQAANRGKLILSEAELTESEAAARAIQSDLTADALLFAPGTKHEHRIEWWFMGRRCQGTLDAFGPTAIPDLKRTEAANPARFPWWAWKMFWPVQATWYADGAASAGLGWRQPFLVAVESSEPYAVTCWRLTEAAIEESRRIYTKWFRRLLECEASDLWPGYATSVLDLDIYRHRREETT